MKLADVVSRPTGTLEVIVRRRGQIIDHWIDRNLVVDASKGPLAHLLGGDVAGYSVTQIAFGTNGTPPVAGNTAITGAYTKALDGHTYPSISSVSYNFSLAAAEDNGMAIFEFGLLCANGTLFARKTRASVLNKASDITLAGTWVIQF